MRRLQRAATCADSQDRLSLHAMTDTLGTRIRSARLARKILQIDLARAAGVDNRQMWRYEAGRSVPSVQTLQRIARHLGCTVDDLLPVVDPVSSPTTGV